MLPYCKKKKKKCLLQGGESFVPIEEFENVGRCLHTCGAPGVNWVQPGSGRLSFGVASASWLEREGRREGGREGESR